MLDLTTHYLNLITDKIHNVTGLPKDKIKHFLTCLPIIAVTMPIDPALSFCTVSVIAIGKEVVWDWLLDKGTPDPWDAVASISAWLPGYLIWWLL